MCCNIGTNIEVQRSCTKQSKVDKYELVLHVTKCKKRECWKVVIVSTLTEFFCMTMIEPCTHLCYPRDPRASAAFSP